MTSKTARTVQTTVRASSVRTHRHAVDCDARQQVPPQEPKRALGGGAEAVPGDCHRDDRELGHELDARQNGLEAAHNARGYQALSAPIAQLLFGPVQKEENVKWSPNQETLVNWEEVKCILVNYSRQETKHEAARLSASRSRSLSLYRRRSWLSGRHA
jgi:hypothetical protein